MQEIRRIALLSNFTVDLIINKLSSQYDFYQPNGYNSWIQEVLNPKSHLYDEKIDAVIVLLDGFEAHGWSNIGEAFDKIEEWEKTIDYLVNQIETVPIFISTVSIRENRIKSLSEKKYKYELENEWYQYIQSIVEEKNNIYVLDVADIITDIGRNSFYSNKMWYMGSMPYSRDGLRAIVSEIENVLSSAFVSRKKIISLDLDNTLWGGVIGEEGINGIILSNHNEGERFFDFQRQLLEMKNRGVLLAINSKNNEEEALEAIRKHSAMLLRENAFVIKKINWNNKADNLKAMGAELNLSESGFVFIDDNPIEREIVKGECSEVVVPKFPSDTSELIALAEEIWVKYFRPLRVLDEDVSKTQMYQTDVKRKNDMKNCMDISDYIRRLDMVVDIHRMREEEVDRVVQLINKSNQFNLTTKRYTKLDIERIANSDDSYIYVAHNADKYGDNGLISVIVLFKERERISIDTFLMSCRVMGRQIEDVIINEIISNAKCKKIFAEYIPTRKNVPVKSLYEKLGFMLVSETKEGRKLYELDTSSFQKKEFGMFKEIKYES